MVRVACRTTSKKLFDEGLKDAEPDDFVILSDSDEIPISKLNLNDSKKFVVFSKNVLSKLNLQNLKESNDCSKIMKKYILRLCKI